ncbi:MULTISPECIES: hypothetical protein [Burkholderia]|uniref:Uncharacterized protein n=1 Tax=Burkholderia contaminans TaxID=488447 RepID=A0A2S5DRD7_9BURK|nr:MULTISPECIES: hypothetical protein [Burkholderia]EKS9798265.1 hypothetical protein [Burkholderia cepacia]EKS9805749.1 hypothetical protein [Burkholderia cepacia]EKS9813104.1 hypothetical protein [Burkholderia cepacia]EKS9822116.1 hypothetical protein [Burkholderia cepacia]EKS9827345.1 hypothetical protein [Burkholderia cepacia]
MRRNNKPTAADVLAVMKPGVIYAPYNLAIQFNMEAGRMRPILEGMAIAGQLSRMRVPKSGHDSFCIAGTEPRAAAPREKYVGTPAAPRTHFVMTGDLDSYMSEIRRRADLCMMVRR